MEVYKPFHRKISIRSEERKKQIRIEVIKGNTDRRLIIYVYIEVHSKSKFGLWTIIYPTNAGGI